MKSRLIHKFSQSQKYRILCVLKRKGSLSVPDLLKDLSLSYMGIKQHCMELERDGYLLKKRKPKMGGRGRPEQMYELTPTADELFPCHDTPLTCQMMSALKSLYGTNAPEKILFTIYQEIIQQYRQSLSAASVEERIQNFLQLREKDGYLSDFTFSEIDSEWKITEYHSPMANLMREFSILLNFELQIYQKILHPRAQRVHHSMTPYCVVYKIPKE